MGEDELASPDRKLRYNRRLFAVVAPRYDLVTRLLSLGRDAAWKRMLLEMLPPDQEWSRADAGRPAVLDLACGTGDITVLLARRYPRGAVLGLDLTEEMLVRARDRVLASSRA
ncbi:MAG: methyltransferase domain-containing protein, partial [Spirochaetaceae bacterium]